MREPSGEDDGNAGRGTRRGRRLLRYLLYSSTTRLSLMSWPNSERSGAPLNVPCHLLRVDFDPRREADLLGELQRVDDAELRLRLARRPRSTSPARHSADGMFRRLPLTRIEPCVTSWRASARVEPSPSGRRRCRAATRAASAGSRRSSPCPRRLDEVAPELALEHAVDAAQLLLLAQLVAVVRHAHARTSARAGRAWCPACTSSRASGARSSGTGRCLPVAPACIWVRCIEPSIRHDLPL